MRIRIFITLLLSNVWYLTFGQADTNELKHQFVYPVVIARNFNHKYQQKLWQVKRAYPLALEAKRIIDSLDAELALVEKKRKQKKVTKSATKEVKDEFTFILKDLYIVEGEMLMKLIHRETGMTVDEIISTYKGKATANVSRATFALYGHNTRDKFYPKGEDWITEIVLQDIESGKIKFDLAVKPVTKAEFKEGMKDYRQGVRNERKRKQKQKKPLRNKRLSIWSKRNYFPPINLSSFELETADLSILNFPPSVAIKSVDSATSRILP